MHFAVCGLHLSAQPLNHQLIEVHARLIGAAMSSTNYTMHALSSSASPTKPAMVYHPAGGVNCRSIALEIWDIPDRHIGALFKLVKPPLAFGTLVLDDASTVHGFVCEGWAADPVACQHLGIITLDISKYGGWKQWRASQL